MHKRFLAYLGLAAFLLLGIAVHDQTVVAAPGKGKSSEKAGGKSKKPKAKSTAEEFPRGPREKEFIKKLGEDYKIKRTAHFFILYNTEDEITKDFIPRLEKTYDMVTRFASQMKFKVIYPKEKLPVIFCNNFEEYSKRSQQFAGQPAPSQAAGLYYRHPLNFSLFYDMSQVDFIKETNRKAEQLQAEARGSNDPAVRKAKSREAQWYINQIAQYQQEQNRSVVQHEVAHQLLFNLNVHNHKVDNPQWLVEGMATLFEPPPGKTGAGFNVINQQRLGDIRGTLIKEVAGAPAASGGRNRPAGPARQQPVQMKAEDFKSFIANPSPSGGMLSNEGYAQSWAVCYYLVKRKSKQLPAYLELIRKREVNAVITPEQDLADFEKCFGKVDDTFTKKWANFITTLPYLPPS